MQLIQMGKRRWISPFQNVWPASVKTLNTGGKLDVQTGPKRFIPQCPHWRKTRKVCKISEEDRPLRFYVPMFWTMSSTTVT